MLLRIVLFPFSLLYGLITFVRNKLYDWNCLASVRYKDPCVISVGNITVGGTGKTPFVEYLLRQILSRDYKVAVLSRGYKRTTQGFMFVETSSTAEQVGDEPCQIKQKFPDIVVAVDADRIAGISKIRKVHSDIGIILLDDAFQYRKIKPALSILLSDYNRPLYRDSMLPGGRLREWTCFAKRADVMIVTKSPADLSSEERGKIMRRYQPIFPRELFFTTIAYGELFPVFENINRLTNDLKQYDVLLVTGIANPKPYETYIRKHAVSVQTITFPDHHAFSDDDVKNIVNQWDALSSDNKLILTTEKDAVRLQHLVIPEAIIPYCYYIPIEVKFIDDPEMFLQPYLFPKLMD